MSNEQILGLLNPMIAMVFAMTFLILWSRRKTHGYILSFAFSYLMLETGFFVSHLVSDPSSQTHVLGTHFFYCMGVMSLLWGLGSRSNIQMPFRALLTISIVTAIALSIAQDMSNYTNSRLYMSNGAYGLMLALGVYRLRHTVHAGPIDKLLVAMIALTVLQFWIRPAVTLPMEGDIDDMAYRDTAYYSILNVTIALLSLMLAISLISACVYDMLREVRDSSEKDHLTGLQIRKAFDAAAAEVFEKHARSALPLCVMVADIDHFTNINDLSILHI